MFIIFKFSFELVSGGDIAVLKVSSRWRYTLVFKPGQWKQMESLSYTFIPHVYMETGRLICVQVFILFSNSSVINLNLKSSFCHPNDQQ